MTGWSSTPWSMNIGKVREPTLLEHFANTALESLAQTLIREAIQNSLDAAIRLNGLRQRPVRARVFVSGSSGALSGESATRWFGDLFPHLIAQGRGRKRWPAAGDACSYLTFEDFGTRGLVGAYDRNYAEDGEENAWVYFFHKEGDTAKQESDRGRWGVGKVVFPGSSGVNAFLAYTVREDGKRLMMGQAMLRSRTVDGTKFLPDAWYCLARSPDLPPMPIEDHAALAEFCNTFNLKRRHETGLSIVVPYVEEGDADADDPGITAETILGAVIADYFLPILRGDLVVEVASTLETHELNADTLSRHVDESRSKLVDQRREEIALASSYVEARRTPSVIGMHGKSGALKWSDEMISEELRQDLRREFDSGEPVTVRVPVQIRSKVGTARDSYFDVHLRNVGSSAFLRPLFVREGLIIPDVKGARVRGVHSLVVAEDGGVATLLGDAENPAHTEWQPKSSNFKDKYLFGPSYLRFVMESVDAIVRRIANDPVEEDQNLLLDVFSLPVEESTSSTPRRPKTKRGGVDPSDPPIPPIAKPRRFRVEAVPTGFKIIAGDAELMLPARLVVRAAYHVRRGDPFSRWSAADFVLSDLAGDCVSAEPIELGGNRMVFKITAPTFSIMFTGFDDRRDVRVDVRTKEASNEAHD